MLRPMVAYEGLFEISHHDLKKNKLGLEEYACVWNFGKEELIQSSGALTPSIEQIKQPS